MTEKPSTVIGQLTPEVAAARNANWEKLKAKHRKADKVNDTTLIPFQSAVKDARTEWAQKALNDICEIAQKQQLAYKDGSVDIRVDGENLRVKVGKITKRYEFQLWVAEPSLLALDRLLVARREKYRQENMPDGEAYVPVTTSALYPEMIHRGENAPVLDKSAVPTMHPAKTHNVNAPKFHVPEVSKRPDEAKKDETFFGRDKIREALDRVLTEKMRNPANQGSESFSTAADFSLVIDVALKDVPEPSSKTDKSKFADIDKPFGLEQMQLFRANIKSRINYNPRASAGLGVLIQAIDETMEAFWNERPLNFRETADAIRRK